MTVQRCLIIRVISDLSHPSAEEIYMHVHSKDAKISIATVYRTINLLLQYRIIKRLALGDGKARYEVIQDGYNHFHIIDIKSGKIIEFFNEELNKLQQKIAFDHGFKIVSESLDLYCIPIDEEGQSIV